MPQLPTMTERQQTAWPELVARAERYVDDSLPAEPHRWMIAFEPEVRPGRGHDLSAVHLTGEHVVVLSMDVYGNGDGVHVASTERIHEDADDDCDCEHCEEDRRADEEQR